MKKVLFVHGMGVMKDARGMFTVVAEELSKNGIECILLDLNETDGQKNVRLKPISVQAEIVKNAHDKAAEGFGGTIDVIAHSQGCLVAALADLPNVRKSLFLAPQVDTGIEKTIEYFSKNPMTVVDLKGISRLARRDGTFTMVPSEYWADRLSIDAAAAYRSYVKFHETIVIRAGMDDVIDGTKFSDTFADCKMIEIPADHDFNGEMRLELSKICKALVVA